MRLVAVTCVKNEIDIVEAFGGIPWHLLTISLFLITAAATARATYFVPW